MPRLTGWTPPETPFTLAHVAPLGVTAAMLRWGQSTGRITRLTTGVFIATAALPDEPASRHVLAARALQLRNPVAIASHHTAALAWGLDLPNTRDGAASLPAFTIPESPQARSRRTRELSLVVRTLPVHHRTTHPSGLRVTTPARTAVDVAAGLRLPEALVALDAAARHQLAGSAGSRGPRSSYSKPSALAAAQAPLLDAVGPASTQFSRAHLLGVVSLADPRRESATESLSFGHFVLAGIPAPELQVRIPTGDGDFYPDFLWREAMVIGEADGAVQYANPESLILEKRRQEILEDLGFRIVRWMYEDIVRRPGWWSPGCSELSPHARRCSASESVQHAGVQVASRAGHRRGRQAPPLSRDGPGRDTAEGVRHRRCPAMGPGGGVATGAHRGPTPRSPRRPAAPPPPRLGLPAAPRAHAAVSPPPRRPHASVSRRPRRPAPSRSAAPPTSRTDLSFRAGLIPQG